MGLKCSVLGHNYGDATVERDREEQGSEVVITIRETETCSRCGHERVVSENKEVTSIATPDERDDEAVDAGGADAGDGSESVDAADAGAASDAADAGEVDAAESGRSPDADGAAAGAAGGVDAGVGPDESADPSAGGGTDAGPVDEATPPADGSDAGAEILDAADDEPVTDDELADPSIEASPDDPDPDPTPEGEEDAVIMGETADSDEGESDETRDVGEWPDEPDESEDRWTPDDARSNESTITAPDEGTDANVAVTVPDGRFRCPGCGYETAVESSSLRAGDFCPECRTETLVHDAGDETRKG